MIDSTAVLVKTVGLVDRLFTEGLFESESEIKTLAIDEDPEAMLIELLALMNIADAERLLEMVLETCDLVKEEELD